MKSLIRSFGSRVIKSLPKIAKEGGVMGAFLLLESFITGDVSIDDLFDWMDGEIAKEKLGLFLTSPHTTSILSSSVGYDSLSIPRTSLVFISSQLSGVKPGRRTIDYYLVEKFLRENSELRVTERFFDDAYLSDLIKDLLDTMGVEGGERDVTQALESDDSGLRKDLVLHLKYILWRYKYLSSAGIVDTAGFDLFVNRLYTALQSVKIQLNDEFTIFSAMSGSHGSLLDSVVDFTLYNALPPSDMKSLISLIYSAKTPVSDSLISDVVNLRRLMVKRQARSSDIDSAILSLNI